MIDRLLASAGVDPIQWRALTSAYLRMDLRRGGGATDRRGRPRGRSPLTGLLFVTMMASVALTFASALIHDAVLFTTLVATYGAFNTGVVLLVDFTSLVVSPDDYRVLGCRPVDSRTYFAARCAAILAYTLGLGTALAFLPSASLWIVRDLGGGAFIASMAAVLLCDLSATVLVIAGYALLVKRVHPRRLTRALSYLQLAMSTLFLGGYYLAMLSFQSSSLPQLSMSDLPWIWLDPAAWFASFVAVATGTAGAAEWFASATALAVTAACLPIAAGRMSLEYAERLAELGTASEAPVTRRSVMTRIPGFKRGEAHAIALLVRAQFRYDNRFRLAILGIIPLTAFYVLLGLHDGAMIDPFAASARNSGGALYFAIVFLPMTLHSSLATSDSWRAAWIFFATPADPAKLIVAAKNFVAVWFLGGYLLALALLWTRFYERVWHAFAHACIVGILAHLLLQFAVIVHPAVPFAAEPRRAERSSQFLLLFLVGGVIAGIVPVLLPFIYARPSWTGAMLALLLGTTAATEYALRLRAREAVGEMEFGS